jgi:molybdopterin molybdotransferase
MLDFFSARERVLAQASRLGVESAFVSTAYGRVLAEDLHAAAPLPPFAYSAMDGYAVHSRDFEGEGPWVLPIAGECRAGDERVGLPAGRALRIFTGAPLPEGADSIVIQENADRRGDSVQLAVRPEVGEHVRRAGEDLAEGALALARGTRLGGFQLGLIAALDRESVQVARRPRVTVLASGNELRAPGSPPRPGTIPDSNGVAIASLARAAGAEAQIGPRILDDAAQAAHVLSEQIAACDVLVTVGGVSVGDHDVVRPALIQTGAVLDFWKVAIKPGKPFTFGRKDRTFIVGLPGNPVSAQITFALFGMPLLRALQGDAAPLPPLTRVKLERSFTQKTGRMGLYRARVVDGMARFDDNQASGSTVSLARADALVLVPADVQHCAAGTELEAIFLSQL